MRPDYVTERALIRSNRLQIDEDLQPGPAVAVDMEIARDRGWQSVFANGPVLHCRQAVGVHLKGEARELDRPASVGCADVIDVAGCEHFVHSGEDFRIGVRLELQLTLLEAGPFDRRQSRLHLFGDGQHQGAQTGLRVRSDAGEDAAIFLQGLQQDVCLANSRLIIARGPDQQLAIPVHQDRQELLQHLRARLVVHLLERGPVLGLGRVVGGRQGVHRLDPSPAHQMVELSERAVPTAN